MTSPLPPFLSLLLLLSFAAARSAGGFGGPYGRRLQTPVPSPAPGRPSLLPPSLLSPSSRDSADREHSMPPSPPRRQRPPPGSAEITHTLPPPSSTNSLSPTTPTQKPVPKPTASPSSSPSVSTRALSPSSTGRVGPSPTGPVGPSPTAPGPSPSASPPGPTSGPAPASPSPTSPPPPQPPSVPPGSPPPPSEPGFLITSTQTVTCGGGALLVPGPSGGRRLVDPCDTPGTASYTTTETYELLFCVDCAQACKDRNQAKLSAYVAQHADDTNHQASIADLLSIGFCLQPSPKVTELGAAGYNNGVCDDACNNLDCAHDLEDCSYEDIYDLCVPEQKSDTTLATAPSTSNSSALPCDLPVSEAWQCPNLEEEQAYTKVFDSLSTEELESQDSLVQVGLQVGFTSPLSLSFQTANSTMLITAEIAYKVQWSDPRLLTVACRKMLSYYMGIDASHSAAAKAVADSVKALQWVPEVKINGVISSVDSSRFYLNETMPWLDDAVRLPAQSDKQLCQSCAVYMATTTVSFSLSEVEFGTYQYFPFDAHTLTIQVSIQDTARFHSCGNVLRDPAFGWLAYPQSITTSDFQAILLPSTKEWTLLNKPDDVTFSNVFNTPNACEIELRLARNPLVFMIKQILITIFFVLCGLFALLLAPTDMIGDRITTVLFSALITTTNMQGDIGLGSPQYILWYDYFNLVQFVILLAVLIECIYVHRLVIRQRTKTAHRLDRICLISITLVYVMTMIVLFIAPFSRLLSILLAAILIPAFIVGSIMSMMALWRRESRKRSEALQRLHNTAGDDAEAFRDALRTAYLAYDYDGSGTLSLEQLQAFLSAVYPQATKPQLLKCLTALRKLLSDDHTLSFASFEAAFESLVGPVLGRCDSDWNVEEAEHLKMPSQERPSAMQKGSSSAAEASSESLGMHEPTGGNTPTAFNENGEA